MVDSGHSAPSQRALVMRAWAGSVVSLGAVPAGTKKLTFPCIKVLFGATFPAFDTPKPGKPSTWPLQTFLPETQRNMVEALVALDPRKEPTRAITVYLTATATSENYGQYSFNRW